MFCVVNANREQTQTANQVIKHIKAIEKASGLKVTGLVNNTHLIKSNYNRRYFKRSRISYRSI